jgi:DNA (cytosine-5)-methyltransferase 1
VVNVLALCSGVGGLELGLKLAVPSARVVCYVEREAFAATVLVARMEDGCLDDAPIWTDVGSFDGQPWRGVVDCIVAGFPCQPWSQAGRQEGVNDERWIWGSIMRIIRDVGPRHVFLENVPGLLHGGIEHVLSDLAEGGFDVEWDVFSALASGAPHLRKRLFIMAHSGHDGRAAGNRNTSEEGHERLGRRDALGKSRADGERTERDVADARGTGLSGRGRPCGSRTQHSEPADCGADGGEESTNADSESADGLAESWPNCGWWATEPDVGRVADGVALRVDRLRAIGNGVVPAVAARAWQELIQRGHDVVHQLPET